MRPVRFIAAAAAISLICGLPAVGVTAAAAQPAPPDPSAAAEKDLRSQSSGKVTVRRDERGIVHFVGTEKGKPVRRSADVQASSSAERKAAAHLKRYGALWALDKKGMGVRATRTHQAAGQQSVVRFEQTIGGVPVLGGELAVAVDSQGNLQSVSGETTPLELPAEPLTVPAQQAQETAVRLAARVHRTDVSALRAGAAAAYAFDPTLLGPTAKPGISQVWKVEVTGPAHIRHLVLVNRARGNVALHFNQVAHAKDRVVCDRTNVRDTQQPNGDPTLANCLTAGSARTEGGPVSAAADVNAAYDFAGDTSDYFADQLGVDLTALIGSPDADGTKLRSTVRYCMPEDWDPDCPMNNAFWNGKGMFYGEGFPQADDVVAHELTHGVTEKTAGLAYWYQSGAINESMSDVFGELVDLTNPDDETEDRWKLGEGSPFGVVRSMSHPPAYGDPDKMTSSHYDAQTVADEDFDNGGVHGNSGVGNKAAYLIAREAAEGPETFNGRTVTGIGHEHAADVYYRALQMLTSGADYQDLYGVLPQACTNLIGIVTGLSTAHCAEVTKAVQATEMNLQPLSADAKAPEAYVGCTTSTKKNLFSDGFEGSITHWARTSGMWAQVTGYAKSGTKSLYGREPDRPSGDPANTYARLAKSFKIPAGVKTYLRFDQQYLLAHWPGDAEYPTPEYYTGARVEYSTNGSTWSSAMGLTWDGNGTVPKTITPYNSDGSPGTKYKAFGGDSHGYTSSRVDLSSLAGKTVQLRWRIFGDPAFSLDGWTLDNVNLYACGGATPSEPRSVTATGSAGKATVKWTAPLWPGTSGLTKYKITMTYGSSSKVFDNISPSATSKVVSGLSSGVSHTFKVQAYSSGGAGPSASKKLVGTKITATASPSTIKKGATSKIYGKAYRVDTGKGYSGWTMRLQGRKKGSTSWSTITSKTTGSGGAYYFYVKPSYSWQYRVVYLSGNSTYLGTYSPIRTVTVS